MYCCSCTAVANDHHDCLIQRGSQVSHGVVDLHEQINFVGRALSIAKQCGDDHHSTSLPAIREAGKRARRIPKVAMNMLWIEDEVRLRSDQCET